MNEGTKMKIPTRHHWSSCSLCCRFPLPSFLFIFPSLKLAAITRVYIWLPPVTNVTVCRMWLRTDC